MRSATADKHLERLKLIVDGQEFAEEDAIASSWKRSAVDLGVDPESNEAPRILSPGELKDHSERARELSFIAHRELDQLFRVSRSAGYVVLLSNRQGILIDHRVDEPPTSRTRAW